MRIHRHIAVTLLTSSALLASGLALAQAQPESPAARKAEAREAAKEFKPGDGTTIQNPPPPDTKAQSAAARESSRRGAVAAARNVEPGEGQPEPAKTPKVSKADRQKANAARRAKVRAENKAGKIPAYGEAYGEDKK